MVRTLSRTLPLALVATALNAPLHAQSSTKPTIAQFMSPASPLELASAAKADRVAWITYERGMRNVYSAVAPEFKPVKMTNFTADDGVDMSDVSLSDDGTTIVFVRGSAPNRQGWVANPSHDPNGGERAIWAVRTTGGPAWRVAVGGSPELSPDGRYVLYVKDGQIYRARVSPGAPASMVDTGGKAFITQWGRQSSPKWSPDGSHIAFVSERDNHALIGVYDVKTRTVEFASPSVDCDAGPVWSPDGKQLAFIRRPGVPFGAQTQSGGGGIGNPGGAASSAAAARQPFSGCGGGFGFGGGGGNRGGQTPNDSSRGRRAPGLYSATFPGGYTTAIMIADITSKPHAVGGYPVRQLWHNAPNDRVFANIRAMQWAAGALVFPMNNIQGDEWDRWYSISTSMPTEKPVLLTTTNGLIEDATSAALSKDGKTLYYSTNANDIERRHIWAVPVSGGEPKALTSGKGIETWPQPLASGKYVATIYFGAKTPASIGIVPGNGGDAKLVFPSLASFPQSAHVEPEIVLTKAADGLEIHNQLFLPADLKPGEKRPAIVFVHGGPQRQMMPGYHYMQFYHWAYAVNQWLASQGYVVLSINYRSGIGYGRSFRNAENTNARGNSEYQDVVAGAKYLQSRSDVDAGRVGIWGLSYGGLLTSQALARNSDIFVAGADLAGVHLYGNSLDSTQLSYRSSAISAIDTWKSPVFLVQGDDDRNVDFAQMVGLVQLLRAHNVEHELYVIPDDVHESLIHARWIETWEKMGDFLHRKVWEHPSNGVKAADSSR